MKTPHYSFAAMALLLFFFVSCAAKQAQQLSFGETREVKIGDFIQVPEYFKHLRVDDFPRFYNGYVHFAYGQLCSINKKSLNTLRVVGISGQEIMLEFNTDDERQNKNRRCPSGIHASVSLEKYLTMKEMAAETTPSQKSEN